MAVQHNTLPDAELHQPKGIASASNDQILFSQSNAASWEYERVYLMMELPDVGTANSVTLPVPVSLRIDSISTSLDGAITGSDATVTFSISGVAITSGVLTIAVAGSAKGVIDTVAPSALNTANAGDYIEMNTDGASSGTAAIHAVLICKRLS